MNNQKIKVCIAGATGWAGSALAKGVINSPDMELVSAVSRKNTGKNLLDILNMEGNSIPVFASVEEALKIDCDVLVEYTKPDIAKNNIFRALDKKVNVVVGTSGLTDEDYQEIEQSSINNNSSVLAVGNFAITVVLLQKFSEMAAKYIPNWEIIDYASDSKIDAPSGTARELANRLGQVRESQLTVPLDQINGIKETRGGRLNGSQVHSVRVPGFVISIESLFGMKDERLTIRHDSGTSAEPYVAGALLAIRKVSSFKGLQRGLDTVMDF